MIRSNFVFRMLLVIALLIPNACSISDEFTTITIRGSDTMVMLVKRWTEAYPNKENIHFQVTGGGSGTGFAALINGTVDICASSRPINKSEMLELLQRYNHQGTEVRVARDHIALLVHKDNPVKNITIEQIASIYSGKITNWKELGGKDSPIVLYSRENTSGTYAYFRNTLLKGKAFPNSTQYLVGTGALVNAVMKDINGIGFGGIAYSGDVQVLAVAKDSQGQFVLPTSDAPNANLYPAEVTRMLYLYVREHPEGAIKHFIDWIISKPGQVTALEEGYFTMR